MPEGKTLSIRTKPKVEDEEPAAPVKASPAPARASKPASDKNPGLQDAFLNTLRREKAAVTVFLVKGVKLQGIITWFDNFCVLLRRDGHSQLVYKHAISTVMPVAPVQLYDEMDEVEEAVE